VLLLGVEVVDSPGLLSSLPPIPSFSLIQSDTVTALLFLDSPSMPPIIHKRRLLLSRPHIPILSIFQCNALMRCSSRLSIPSAGIPVVPQISGRYPRMRTFPSTADYWFPVFQRSLNIEVYLRKALRDISCCLVVARRRQYEASVRGRFP
jgi:hypothetical protein